MTLQLHLSLQMCTEIRSLQLCGRHAHRRKMRHPKPIQQQRPSSPQPLPTTPRPRSNLTPQRPLLSPPPPPSPFGSNRKPLAKRRVPLRPAPKQWTCWPPSPRPSPTLLPLASTQRILPTRRCADVEHARSASPPCPTTCDWPDESAANDCERRADPTTCSSTTHYEYMQDS